MIIGRTLVPQVIEDSTCRNTQAYEFSEVGDYKVHGTSLMPNIPFEESSITPYEIDESIFINVDETELKFEKNVRCQNFLTTQYVGRAPLEFYGPKTKRGRVFLLKCIGGDPSYDTRVFGTKDAIRGFNRDANENVIVPKEDA